MFNIIRSIVFVLSLVLGVFRPLLILQQTGYRAKEYFVIIKNKPLYSLVSLLCIVFSICLVILNFKWTYLCVVVAYCVFLTVLNLKKTKKPLVYTKRVIRLLIVYGVLVCGLTVMSVFFRWSILFAFCSEVILLVANLICSPIENRIANGFISKAKAKLRRINPIIIAITGSFGKTSFKNVLEHILKSQYKVCASPKSFNTPMGLAKCINENLADDDKIFIAEAGARYKGDISKICRFIRPDIAVITAIGNQHLSTFKTEERLFAEKFSIVCDSVFKVFINTDTVKTVPYIKDKEVVLCGKSGDVHYSDACIDRVSQSFTVHGKYIHNVSCDLLADYVPSTVNLAVAIAESLGISQKNIKNSIKTLKPIAHRLEILYNDKDVIIDDAYNSNENGFKSAINLLALYTDKIKVVITPGVVELGSEQSVINESLAVYASKRVDWIFTYGTNSFAIKRGGKDKCVICSDLAECMERYKRIQGERAVLFENDLPDTY